MPRKPNLSELRATLDGAELSSRVVRMVAARIGALVLLVVAAVVPATTREGPIMIVFASGYGLHALDVAVILIGVPVAVLLLRHAELIREDESPVRSRPGRTLRQRWASANAAHRGDLSLRHPDLPVFGAAAITGGIGMILALASSTRSVVIVGGMFIGGAIVVVATRLADARASPDPKWQSARLRLMIAAVIAGFHDRTGFRFQRASVKERRRDPSEAGNER